MLVKCQMFASCGSAKHFTCDEQLPHEGNVEWFSCPKQIIFGTSSMVKCFEVREDVCHLKKSMKTASWLAMQSR